MSVESRATHVAFLLHMHQPLYTDPGSGVAILPWVRLHGGRAYLDVARLLDEYPAVRLTVNFVPSLVEQLEAVVSGARDAWLEIALRPTGSWSAEERRFLVERFFSVAWNPNVESRPRYRELLDQRGRSASPDRLAEAARTFTDGDLRDLTVLFHLAWLGFAARRDRPALAALEAKGRGYDEHDLHEVIAAGRAACAEVLPLYRRLAERGQIELSASPYYHPIAPLLCDSDAARRAQPRLPIPDRFSFPDDARYQIALGREAHRRAFGAAPRGMWPPEGSISPEALAAYHAEGIGWLASDEGNAYRSLQLAGVHDVPRGQLYQPFHFGGVDLVFRDRELSDRIGFRYAHGDARASVDDLLSRARHAGEEARAAGIAEPLVPIILDGENPWEHYRDSGQPFLRALFESLGDGRAGCVPTAIGPFLDAHPARRELPQLHSGSWIDSDFHIWIGDPVKNRAWNLLGRARRRWQRETGAGPGPGPGPGPAGALEEARRHLAAAEGSDWFWWFGEPFHSAEDALFDRLFRAHLAAAWRALGEEPPEELANPVSQGSAPPAVRPPRARIKPSIDGRIGTYFEWVGAGRYEVPRGAAMAELPPVAEVQFGFDDDNLYLRLDPSPGAAPRLRTASLDLSVRTPNGEHHFTSPGESAPHIAKLLSGGDEVGRVACDEVLELSLPFSAVGAHPGDRLEVVLRLLESDVALLRVPRDGHLELRVPDEIFDAENWLL